MMEKSLLFSEYFLFRFLINMISMIILIRIVYFHAYQKRDFFFTFFLLNLIVFLLAFMLEKSGGFDAVGMGGAVGLLASFSLLRFRTETISTKDMTYIFIVMTFGMINSVIKAHYLEIISLNLIIIGAVWIVDSSRFIKHQQMKTVEYDSIENLKPERQQQLIGDLRERTGLDIRKVVVENIDFTKNRAMVRIYFY
jgi:hypothetical protein